MKLYYTKRSPYARKALIIAHEKKLIDKIELIDVDLANKPQELLDANPIGAIPTLILDDGSVLFDSPVICEYLDSLAHNPRFFSAGSSRFADLKLAALGDALAERAVAIVLENNRPETQRSDAAITKNRDAISRALASLEKETATLTSQLSIASVAVASALGYINFRLPDLGWEKDYKNLATWYKNFSTRPSMKATPPSV